jgi:peptidyl-prolyl cis-trans isomerase D
MSVPEFEDESRAHRRPRLQALITAGVTVGDQEVRDDYRKENIKIKFDYAVISSDDLRKTINPSDSDLEAFFKKNAARYATAVPEERKITYFAFTPNEIPGGVPQPTQQEIQQYFNAHQSRVLGAGAGAVAAHSHQGGAGADAKTDAAAKAKAEGILKQIQAAELCRPGQENSDDPGSKDKGGELGFAQRGTHGAGVRQGHLHQKIGDIADCEEPVRLSHCAGGRAAGGAHAAAQRSAAHHSGHADSPEGGAGGENYAQALTSEAIKNGLEKTAAAHHLEVVTTPPVAAGRDCRAARRFADSRQGLRGQAGRSAAVRAHRRRLRDLPGHRHSPAHAPELCRLEEPRADDYRDEQLPALLSQKTKELADKAKAMNDLAKAAKEVGATVKTSDLVGESGQVPDLGQVARWLRNCFDLKWAHQRAHQRAAHRRGGQDRGQAGAERRRDRQELRPDARPDAGTAPQGAFSVFPERCHGRLQEEQAHPDERQGKDGTADPDTM